MINVIIAALVATFFWGKATKDIEEKTQLASKMKFSVYGVLAFVVFVFYLKSYQVATVSHTIQLNGLRETVDTTGHVVDSIAKIQIVNRFSSGITENASMETSDKQLKKVLESGGINIVLNLESGDTSRIRNNSEIEKQAIELNKYAPMSILGGRLLEYYSHAYEAYYFTNTVPSFIPLFSEVSIIQNDKINNFTPFCMVKIGDFNSFGPEVSYRASVKDVKDEEHSSSESKLKDDMYVAYNLMTDTLTKSDGCSYKFYFYNNFINRFNFLTAADISQYTCDVCINTDCYVQKLIIDHDLPIEINSYDSCMEVNSYGILAKGDFLNKDIVKNGSYRFHIKLPTLANLQLIRSLILTTLLTAFSSMFILNLFYWLRKKALNFKEKHITEISVEKVKNFKTKVNVLLSVFLVVIFYITLRICNNEPFHVSIEMFDWIYAYYGYIIVSIVLVTCLILYLMFRGAYTIKKKDKKK